MVFSDSHRVIRRPPPDSLHHSTLPTSHSPLLYKTKTKTKTTPLSHAFLRFPEKMSKCNRIRHIVRIRQMLRQWRRKARTAASASASRTTPSDVPAGHVAVCVGSSCRRFIVRATYLNHPIFKKLLVQAEEEYGFSHVGPLTIPCDESTFEEILRVVSRPDSGVSGRFSSVDDIQRCCHVGIRDNNLQFLNESRPLLRGALG